MEGEHEVRARLRRQIEGGRLHLRLEENGERREVFASNGNLRILKLLAEDMLQANRSQLRTLCEHLVEYADEAAAEAAEA